MSQQPHVGSKRVAEDLLTMDVPVLGDLTRDGGPWARLPANNAVSQSAKAVIELKVASGDWVVSPTSVSEDNIDWARTLYFFRKYEEDQPPRRVSLTYSRLSRSPSPKVQVPLQLSRAEIREARRIAGTDRKGFQHVSVPLKAVLDRMEAARPSNGEIAGSSCTEMPAAPVLELRTGVRVANFSSGHPFHFGDDYILPACDSIRVERLKLEPQEQEFPGANGWTDIVIDFKLTGEVLDELTTLVGCPDIDVVIVPRVVMDSLKSAGLPFGKCRTIRIKRRSQDGHPAVCCDDKFCI